MESPANLYPWVVYLELDKDGDEEPTRCGGSILTTKHILSAAHCFTNYTTTDFDGIKDKVTVYAGLHNYTGNGNGFKVSKIIYHPYYIDLHINGNFYYLPHYGNHAYDAAILVLKSELKFSKESFSMIYCVIIVHCPFHFQIISPICLPPDHNTGDYVGKVATVAGWGKTGTGNENEIDLPNELRRVNVTIHDNNIQRCINSFRQGQV